jgi:hypothetical protein
MKTRKKLLFVIGLAVIAAASLTTWAIARANSRPQPINTRYLDTFFQRYVASLNSKSVADMMSFYTDDSKSVMAWGVEMDNAQRAAYYAACKEAFPNAVIEIRKVTIEPTGVTSGLVTWEFGIKSGPQMAPFMGVYKKVDNAPKTDGYDQVGVSTGQIAAIGQGALETIKEMEGQVAALDKEIRTLDEQIAELNEELGEGANYAADAEGGSSSAVERFTLAEKRSTLVAERAAADQRLLDYAASSIKFTRQSSFQNMDAFLKKIGGK